MVPEACAFYVSPENVHDQGRVLMSGLSRVSSQESLSISAPSVPGFQTPHPTRMPFVIRNPTLSGVMSNTFRTGQTALPHPCWDPKLRDPHLGQKGGCVQRKWRAGGWGLEAQLWDMVPVTP